MYSCFTDYLLAKAPFTGSELAKIDVVTYKREVKKGELLFEEGSQWMYNGFICSGLLYNYTTSPHGTEKILGFAPENHWVGDRNSLLTGKPMPHSARALEDSHLIYIENNDFEKLRIVISRFDDIINSLIQKHIATVHKHISEGMVLSDEERYAGFLKAKPMLPGRVPVAMVASYLDITPQSFDRILNGIPWEKK